MKSTRQTEVALGLNLVLRYYRRRLVRQLASLGTVAMSLLRLD
jgi:hypothetical protein